MLGRQRHDDELRRVYREHLDAVFAFFAYAVGRSTAEDLTATTFERVVKHWRRYDAGQASERTWILAIARNTLIDHYRRQSHRKTTSLDEYPLIAQQLASDHDPLAGALAIEGFTHWLADLSSREREVLALRYAADLTGAEIAETMDLTEANVHQIISRALRKLRAKADAGGAADAPSGRAPGARADGAADATAGGALGGRADGAADAPASRSSSPTSSRIER